MRREIKRPDRGLLAAFSTPQDLGMAGGAHRLDHLEDALAHPRLADLVVGAHQFQRLALDQRILFPLERRTGLAEALAPATGHWPAGQRVGRHFVEEIGHRHIQYLGEFEQPARADAVGAALVLLDLLEGQADSGSNLRLTHSEEGATLAHARADVNIYSVRLRHASTSLDCSAEQTVQMMRVARHCTRNWRRILADLRCT